MHKGFSSTKFPSSCCNQMQKKILIFVCVVAWIVILFVWRTLFLTRTYDGTNMQMEAVSNYLQEQIHILSDKVSQSEKSSVSFMKALHDKMNLTVNSLNNKVNKLGEAISKRHKNAKQVLQQLNEGVTQNERVTLNEEKKVEVQTVTSKPPPRGNEIISSAFKNDMCIDSMEEPIGNDVELYECHGEGRNQAWALSNGFIKNFVHDICLRSVGFSGSPVTTATCEPDDNQQKWRHANGTIMLVDDESDNKCLEADIFTKKLSIKVCDSKKESQQWKL